MSETSPQPVDDSYLNKVVEAAARLGVVVLLAAWCFQIIRPFITPVVWGVILAVAVFPAFRWLAARLDGRDRLSAGLLTGLGLLAVIVPAVLFTGSLVQTGHELLSGLDAESLQIPPPPADVRDWPIVGSSIYGFWSQASQNLAPLLVQFAPQLREIALWLVSAGVGTGLAVVQSLISIVIAGVVLARASSGTKAVTTVASRLSGGQGERLAEMATATIRSVAVGIVGVAIIQASLIGLGLLVFGVPHAGLWTLVCLFLAVVQLPPLIVVAPIIVYVFSVNSTGVAIAFMIWEILASASDTALKPILLARGVEVPMLVIFMGAIGGFVMSGFIGLFIGAVILSLGYKLFLAWLEDSAPGSEGPPLA